MKKFFEKGERPVVVENGYGRFVLPNPYAIVSYFVMKCFTLEGRYTSMQDYHFPILNHIRHGDKINLPYFLLNSLVASIANGANTPLH